MTTTPTTGGTLSRLRDDRGSALVVALLSLLLLTALGLALKPAQRALAVSL